MSSVHCPRRIGVVPDSKLAVVVQTRIPKFSALENEQAATASCGNRHGLFLAKVYLHERIRIDNVPDSNT